jgi:NAD(P)H-quinone oxidoreductase subunit 5
MPLDPPTIALLALLGPTLLATVSVPMILGVLRPRVAAALGGAAAGLALAAAVLVAATLATGVGPVDHAFARSGPAAFGVYLDAVSATMLVLVAFVGAVVVRYSRRYLDGDAGHARFIGWLCATLAAVQTLAVSGNLAMFATGWIATSLALHRLLVFYAERPAAQLGARKKFLVSRLGDASLVGAAFLTWQVFGTVEFGALFAAIDALPAGTAPDARVHAIAGLLVLAALLKSAQFPFHGWLPAVMDTPTPVSALLHAGIVNAGGFLIVRSADLVSLSSPSLHALAVVGGLTALFAGVVMLTQTSVKVSLAWSTIAQMGFMLLQCGLGMYASALLHVVAHSLYKAHAFLSSGSVVELAKAAWTPVARGRPHPVRFAGVLLLAVLLVAGVGYALGVPPATEPGVVALGAILLMGVAHLLWNTTGEHAPAPVALRGLAIAAGVALVYFALQFAAHGLLDSALPSAAPPAGTFDVVLSALLVAAFMGVLWLQAELPWRAHDARWQAAYVHLHNGCYVDAWTHRILRRLLPVTEGAAR